MRDWALLGKANTASGDRSCGAGKGKDPEGALFSRALHTQSLEVSGPDVADAVEAGVQVGGHPGKRRDALQVDVITVHRGAQAHTDQAGGQAWPRQKTEQGAIAARCPLASRADGLAPGSV